MAKASSKRSGAVKSAPRSGWVHGGILLAGILIAVLAYVLVKATIGEAAPPLSSAVGDPTGVPSLYDTQLAVKARRQLAGQPELAAVLESGDLGVRVRKNVAVLFGRVPTKDLADQAVASLRKMNELEKVFSELEVVAPETSAQEFVSQVDRETARARAKPGTALAPGALVGRNGEASATKGPRVKTSTLEPHVDLKGSGGLFIPGNPRIGSKELSQGVSLLPPVTNSINKNSTPPAKNLPAKTQSPPPSLASQVEKLRQGDDRFAHLKTRVEDGTVFLSPAGAENLFDFAQEVARVPGVKRVVMDSGSLDSSNR